MRELKWKMENVLAKELRLQDSDFPLVISHFDLLRSRLVHFQPSRSNKWSPTRNAFAMIVRAGFTAPLDGKKLASTTYRLSSSWALQLRSSAEVLGSFPNRIVPFWWATAASGNC